MKQHNSTHNPCSEKQIPGSHLWVFFFFFESLTKDSHHLFLATCRATQTKMETINELQKWHVFIFSSPKKPAETQQIQSNCSTSLRKLSHSVVSNSSWPHTLSPSVSPGHGILQAKILEWDWLNQDLHIAGMFFTIWATRENPSREVSICKSTQENFCLRVSVTLYSLRHYVLSHSRF